MKLSTKDRIVLLGALPTQASLEDMGTILEIQKSLELTEDEKKEADYRESSPGRVEWSKDVTKDIDLKHKHIAVLKKAIKKLDEAESILPVQYETFVKINQL